MPSHPRSDTVKGVMPSVKPRTNLATVTMPVRLASAKEIERDEFSPYNVPTSDKIEVPQFSILLTRKNTPIRPGSKTIPVFAQLNKIKASVGGTFDEKRRSLLNELKFAGIAFTHAKRNEDVGDSNLFAAVIGGSHTVMSYNSMHNEDTPLRPGATVRWTLPNLTKPADVANTKEVPVRYQNTGDDVFAELEEVKPGDYIDEIHASYAIDKVHIEAVLRYYESIREREIGTVIGDNGRGTIDIRLK